VSAAHQLFDTLIFIVIVAALAVAILWGGIAFQRSMRLAVTFTSLQEERTIYGVALWATKDHNKESPGLFTGGWRELRYALSLWNYSVNFSWMGSIPVEELRILSPFIDRMIEGKGPPQNLPNEYKDERPETLKRFKDRMIAEGLWPKTQN
jgi:hypothetical protein